MKQLTILCGGNVVTLLLYAYSLALVEFLIIK